MNGTYALLLVNEIEISVQGEARQIEYAVVICFNAVAFQIAPARPTESIIYHFLLFP